MRMLLLSLGLLFGSAAMADDAAWHAEARGVAAALPPRLLQVLNAEITRAGAESAIAVCSEEAPRLARAASQQSGWNVRRVSLRQRNPKAAPDAWEREVLEEFDRRAAAGEAAATLEKAQTLTLDGRTESRYMKALPVGPLCLQCHGADDSLAAPVRERLRERYPADRATGYAPGQIRGAVSLRKPQ